ncbi:synaptonemal complex protein 2-like isoform X2 [Arvicola amphibius]|uniref:synaptonemal complex protein 2-like isoform X2 n=1 Tax=Arvicola amphibius TaxID=1047088 RepID=UPI0018E378C6|nr:synaptonemal complex protein 2-like isoform X2 [Arvicola amphibius]
MGSLSYVREKVFRLLFLYQEIILYILWSRWYSLGPCGSISLSSVHMVSWFERVTGFLTTKDTASDALLTKALGDFLDTALIISRHSRKGTIQMLDSFILSLGRLVVDGTVELSIHQEALSTLNCILDAAPREERRKLSSAEGTCSLMVYSFPCVAAFADDQELRKPADEKLEEFWIDFNLGSRSVTFYIDNGESALWEPVHLPKEAVLRFSVTESDRMKMLIIFLKEPIIISKKEATTIEIHFDRQLDISQASLRALGGDTQTPVLIQVSPGLEKEDGEIPSSPKQEAEHAEECTALPGFVDDEDDRCIITRRLTVQSELATHSEDRSPKTLKPQDPKQEITSKHEHSSHVQESPVRTQASQLDDVKDDSAFKRDREQDRRMLFNYRKHHFSESNEDSGSSASERSWTRNNYKRKSLRTYSQRRKPRVRSLRILPLSPISSDRAREKDQVTLTPVWKGISRQNTILPTFSETKLQGSSVLLTPVASTPKIELGSPHPSGSFSSSEHPEVEENVRQIVSQELFMENSCKHKLENSEHREMPDGSIAAPKQSRLEDAPGSPAVTDISTPSQEDVPDSANSSALKTALENFTRDMKRKFELKQKEIPLSSEKAKEVPGCLVRLWNQIYMRRLNELERFRSSALQELSKLEENLQGLKCLEEDALEFWEKQWADLESFCDQQELRFNSAQPL